MKGSGHLFESSPEICSLFRNIHNFFKKCLQAMLDFYNTIQLWLYIDDISIVLIKDNLSQNNDSLRLKDLKT